MAYPVSGNYESRVSGTTVIKKAWGDELDANMNGLYGATRSLVGLTIDGTGYTSVTAPSGIKVQLAPNGGWPAAATGWVLMHTWDDGKGAGKAQRRLYAELNQQGGADTVAIAITMNASWDGTHWNQDIATEKSTMFLQTSVGIALLTQTAGHAAWPDIGNAGSWNQQFATSDTATTIGNATTISTGGLTVSDTGITITSGGVDAQAGSLTADGDPTLSQGIVTGVHFAGSGGAPTHSLDATNCNVAVAGTDARGLVTLTATAGVTAGVLTKISFAKAYASTPIVLLHPSYDSSLNISNIQVTSRAADSFQITGLQGLNNGSVTSVEYVVIG